MAWEYVIDCTKEHYRARNRSSYPAGNWTPFEPKRSVKSPKQILKATTSQQSRGFRESRGIPHSLVVHVNDIRSQVWYSQL